jgi:hypothetical protein
MAVDCIQGEFTCIPTYIHTYIHTCTHFQRKLWFKDLLRVWEALFSRVRGDHLYIHKFIHTHTHTHISRGSSGSKTCCVCGKRSSAEFVAIVSICSWLLASSEDIRKLSLARYACMCVRVCVCAIHEFENVVEANALLYVCMYMYVCTWRLSPFVHGYWHTWEL